MLGKFNRKKSELKTKQNRVRRRLSELSGESFGALFFLSSSALLCVACVFVYSLLLSSAYFQIREISVRGLKELTEKDILSAADIKSEQNILAINADAVVRNVRLNDWVEEVYIGRELPDKLVLHVRERVPLALVKTGNDFYLMDDNGVIFKQLCMKDAIDLPIITGIGDKKKTDRRLLMNALAMLKSVTGSSDYAYLGTVSEINVDPLFGVSLVSDSGLYLKLGDDNFGNKLKRLKAVLADLGHRGLQTGYLYIDLSDDAKVTVKRAEVPDRTGAAGRHYQI